MIAGTRSSRVIPALVAAVAVILSAAPLYSAYESLGFWIALGGGTLLGTLIAAAGTRWGLGPLGLAAISVVAYFLFGGALALRSESLFGVLPTGEVLSTLALGVVQVWKSMLTAATPAPGVESLLIAPYILGILGALVTGSIAQRAHRPQWLAVPVGVLLLASITFSTYQAFAPAVVGALLAFLILAWSLLAGRSEGERNLARTQASTGRRRAAGAAALGLALAVGLGAGTVTPLPADRAVLRDTIVPPLDMREFASPLTSFREFTSAGDSLKLFTVQGLPAGAVVRLATLDQYDGIVYRVATNGSTGAGQFARVGRSLPTAVDGSPATLTVAIDKLSGVWMPDTGYLTSLAVGDSVQSDRRGGLNYNAGTGTAVLVGGLHEGDEYTAQTVVPTPPTEAGLASAHVASVSLPAPLNVPEVVATRAAEYTAGATTPVAQLKAIEAKLHTAGFFSHGLEGDARSRAGHTAERISTLLEGAQMVGDDEQYAVAMALMARQLGIPARVVMGFRMDKPSPGTVTVTGANVRAWVEAPFEGLGWVSFDPTPPKDQLPKQEVPQTKQKPQPQVQQPPPPVVPPVELPPAPPVKQASDGTAPTDLSALWAALRWTGVGIGVFLILLAPAAVVAASRARRRRTRRAAQRAVDRISGGWLELVDLAVDHGAMLPVGATRREEAALLGEYYPEHPLRPLALRADQTVFGADEPTDAEIAAYWADVETAAARIRGAVGWQRRVRARYFARSLARDAGAWLARVRSRGLKGSAGRTGPARD